MDKPTTNKGCCFIAESGSQYVHPIGWNRNKHVNQTKATTTPRAHPNPRSENMPQPWRRPSSAGHLQSASWLLYKYIKYHPVVKKKNTSESKSTKFGQNDIIKRKHYIRVLNLRLGYSGLLHFRITHDDFKQVKVKLNYSFSYLKHVDSRSYLAKHPMTKKKWPSVLSFDRISFILACSLTIYVPSIVLPNRRSPDTKIY